MTIEPFWQTKTLEQLDAAEWESLCDGCGLCCFHKVEDEDTGEFFLTRVHCKLFNPKTCRCRQYSVRRKIVKDCITLTPKIVRKAQWLPTTCAYRLVAEGRSLPHWHHLISGHDSSVHKYSASAKNIGAVDETHVKDFAPYVLGPT